MTGGVVASFGDVVGGFVGLGILGLAVWLVVDWLRRLGRRWRHVRQGQAPAADTPSLGGVEDGELDDHVRSVLRSASSRVAHRFEDDLYDSAQALERDEPFRESVDEIRALELPTETLISLASGYDGWLARAVLPVIAERDDIPERWLLMVMRRLPPAPWDLAGLLLLSLQKAPGEVIGNALTKAESVRGDDLAALITARVRSGLEVVDAELMRRHVPLAAADQVQMLLEAYALPDSVRRTFSDWLENALDFGEAGRYLKLWSRPFTDRPVLVEGRRGEVADELIASLEETPAHSVVVVGDHGAGKSALIGAALERLPEGWVVFEAGASQINADAMYVGQLEGRVEDLVQRLHGRAVVWIFPALEEALFAGTYSNHPTGLLDALLPHVEAGTVRIVGEVTPSNYELLVAKRPRVQSAFRALRMRPLTERETVRVLEHALEHDGHDVSAADGVLHETVELAQLFLPGVAQPGGAMRLLGATVEASVERGAATFETGDVLASLASLSGLPLALLDPNQPLDLDELRAFFNTHVLGQEPAVNVLIDRIALIKAGLTDPTRPLGVFLFVGPTGTGKTELAKTLAQFMFGSTSRLVRLDMSEFQTPDALERMISDSSVDDSGAVLIAAVRKDPFAVVLLDEFEKAAAPIWDLFLQVFDDGRLTDRSGRTTDFRRCIFIMTTNIGSAIQSGPSLGFPREDEGFRASDVDRAVKRAFRPEFLNRIDRVVTFQPFRREQMRALLEKELDDVFRRRGIRGKPWAMEIDESAVTFLLDAGFSPTLGARPLKRAVEEHLLTPLARTMVDADAPTGDQFLFITAPHGSIEVQFVGLDEEHAPPAEPAATALEREADEGELTSFLRTRHFDVTAQSSLLRELGAVEARVKNEIIERKYRALEAISDPGFWNDEGRYRVLAEAEYLDRLEAACRTAVKLGNRLRSSIERAQAQSPNGDGELSTLLGYRVYSLERALAGLDAEAPFEVFLRLRVVGDQVLPAEREESFLEQLVAMYMAWAQDRGMQVETIARAEGEVLLHAGGLGAGLILQQETGLHILEAPEDKQDGKSAPHERVTISVQVADCEPGERSGDRALLAQARRAFRDAPIPAQVVRRYRDAPSPLVRDAARGYRTGRLDRVLAGDFDLF